MRLHTALAFSLLLAPPGAARAEASFVQTPYAPAELVHWQHQGYAVLTPQIMDKKFSIESIR